MPDAPACGRNDRASRRRDLVVTGLQMWIAARVLRLPLGPDRRAWQRALGVVLRRADAEDPDGQRAVLGAVQSHGSTPVWRIWLQSAVSTPGPRRWESPVVALLDRAAAPDIVIDAAWRDWLDEHQPVLLSLLRRWNRAAANTDPRLGALSRLALDSADQPIDPALLADTATRFDHPIGERARAHLLTLGDTATIDLFCAAAVNSPKAAQWCAMQRLAPSDDMQRAVFFVRTGQPEQYRALDPDGALLALGYRAAAAEERTALRAAMTAFGELDLVHVLAGRRFDPADLDSLTEQERGYVVRQLADQGDWAGLWRLTTQLPLAEAVTAVGSFSPRWRPPEGDDRVVFDALSAIDPLLVRRVVDLFATAEPFGPVPPAVVDLRDIDDRIGAITDIDFSPDGAQLAFIGSGQQGSDQGSGQRAIHLAGVVDLYNRRLVWLNTDFERPLSRIAHLGSGAIAVQERPPTTLITALEAKIHYVDGEGAHLIDLHGAGVSLGAAINHLSRVTGERTLMVCTTQTHADGRTTTMVCLSSGGGPFSGTHVLEQQTCTLADVDPTGQSVIVLDGGRPTMIDLANEETRRLQPVPRRLRFNSLWYTATSPTALICTSRDGGLHIWHDPVTSDEVPRSARVWHRRVTPTGLAWSAALHRFVAVSEARLDILDVPDDPDTPLPDDLIADRISLGGSLGGHRMLRLSALGDVVAAPGSPGRVDAHLLTSLTLRRLIAKPVASMDHHDLAAVTQARKHWALDADTRTVLTLLRTLIDYRFRHDVGLADPAHGMGIGGEADYEIELGGA